MGWGLIMPGIGENSYFLSQPQLVRFEGGWEKVIRNSREQYFITCHFQFLISHRLHESIYLSFCLSVGFTIFFSLRLHLLFHLFFFCFFYFSCLSVCLYLCLSVCQNSSILTLELIISASDHLIQLKFGTIINHRM